VSVILPELATEPSLAEGSRVAAQLNAMAADERFSPRANQLQSLARAVSTPTVNDRGWESVDLFDAFTPESTITIRGRAHTLLDAATGLLAAIAVFLPVAWTWWSMSKASSAYQDLLAVGGGAGESFLQLWVTGFDGRLEALHQLPQMALISVFLILGAVLLLILQRSTSNRRSVVETGRYQQAEVELHEALTQATRLLAIKPVSNNDEFEVLVTRSIRELHRAHEQSAASADRLRQSTETAGTALEASLASVEPLLADVQAATQTMHAAATAMESAAEESGRATVGVVSQLTDDIVKSGEQWRTSHLMAVDASSSAMTKASESLTRGARDLTSIAEQLARDVAGLNAAAQRVPDLLTNAIQSATVDTVREIRDAAPAFDKSTDEMVRSLQGIDSALVGNQSAVQAQVSELTQARDSLGKILLELRALTVALEQMQHRGRS
jgi:hypothetical protein